MYVCMYVSIYNYIYILVNIYDVYTYERSIWGLSLINSLYLSPTLSQ